MRPEIVDSLVRSEQLRKRFLDKEKIKSMIESATTNMKVVKNVSLNDESAMLIFRETYESIRQLGDAKWWLLGYEPKNHDVSLEVLKESDIKEKVKLNYLGRFKLIRHDINYRGFKASVAQATEILDFWNSCADEIIALLLKELKTSR